MARRSDHSREEIREMALQAAERIVEEEGVKGLSARKVASSIGYTVGTLYLVFQNLDDLVLSVNARTLDLLYRVMVDSQLGCDGAERCIVALGRAYIGFSKKEGNRWAMLYESSEPKEGGLPGWYHDKIYRMFSLVEDLLAPIAPHQRPAKVADAAKALWSGVHGISVLHSSNRLHLSGGESVEVLAEVLIKNFLKGFGDNAGA